MENDQNPELEQEPIEADESEGEPKKEPTLTPEQLEGIRNRQITKLKKQLKELGVEVDSRPEKVEKKQTGYESELVKLAFLNSKGIPEEDHDFLLEEEESTGKPINYLVGLNYVKEELAKRKQSRDNQEKAPGNTKRTGTASRSNADYWFSRVERGDSTMADVPANVRHEVRKLRESKYGRGPSITPGLRTR